jgi:hypothetical protein
VHRSLRAGGVVLDTHPEPEYPSVEVWLAGGPVIRIGSVDSSALISNIHAARATIGHLISTGRLDAGQEIKFEFLTQHASVDAWLAYRAQQESTGKLSEEVIDGARALLAESEGVIVLREPSRALRLRRLS